MMRHRNLCNAGSPRIEHHVPKRSDEGHHKHQLLIARNQTTDPPSLMPRAKKCAFRRPSQERQAHHVLDQMDVLKWTYAQNRRPSADHFVVKQRLELHQTTINIPKRPPSYLYEYAPTIRHHTWYHHQYAAIVAIFTLSGILALATTVPPTPLVLLHQQPLKYP